MIQGVIFDMDGLMLDTEPLWGACWEPVCAKFGYEVPEELPAGVRGLAGDMMCAALRRYLGDDAPAEEMWEAEKAMGGELLAQHGAPKKKGLDDLLEYLRGLMLPLAVASSSTKPIIESNLRHAGILEFFDVIISGETLARSKPDPLIFLEAAKLLGTRPSRTLVLEDSLNGVEASAAGGFITVMVPDLVQPTPRARSLCAAVVDDLEQVIDLLVGGELA